MQTTEELSKKMLTHQRIQTAVLIGIFILVLIGLILLLSQFGTINNCLTMIETDLQAVDMDTVNSAVANISALTDHLSELDISSLETAVGSLKDAAENLSKVDISNLNKLVESVQSTAAKLESVSAALSKITSIFG